MAALLMRIGIFVSVHADVLLAVIVFAQKRNEMFQQEQTFAQKET
jgi:hypothetical protein